jgi:hypothetical protein
MRGRLPHVDAASMHVDEVCFGERVLEPLRAY